MHCGLWPKGHFIIVRSCCDLWTAALCVVTELQLLNEACSSLINIMSSGIFLFGPGLWFASQPWLLVWPLLLTYFSVLLTTDLSYGFWFSCPEQTMSRKPQDKPWLQLMVSLEFMVSPLSFSCLHVNYQERLLSNSAQMLWQSCGYQLSCFLLLFPP